MSVLMRQNLSDSHNPLNILHIFHIDEQFTTRLETVLLKRPKSFLSRIFSPCSSYVKEKYFHFDPDILSVPNNSYLEGYWASEKYFQDISDVIRKEFILKNTPDAINKAMMKRISSCNSISIHVRRNDYVEDKKTNDFHGVCGLEYYNKAVSMIGKKIKNPTFFVFSDDPEWCKINLRLDFPTDYVTHNLGKKDYEDMRLMSACKHNIIANSSFSWWGAWLNNNSNKIVVAPKKWFADASTNTADLVPKQWSRI